MNQAERIKETLNEGDFYQRLDLRDTVMVTIDGEDAKDLDDAIIPVPRKETVDYPGSSYCRRNQLCDNIQPTGRRKH